MYRVKSKVFRVIRIILSTTYFSLSSILELYMYFSIHSIIKTLQSLNGIRVLKINYWDLKSYGFLVKVSMEEVDWISL